MDEDKENNENDAAAILPVFIKHTDLGFTMQLQVNTWNMQGAIQDCK